MNPIVRNILAVIAGVVIGGIVNSGLVKLGLFIVPLPEGADVSSFETLAESIEAFAKSMKLFTPVNFLFPFLAHALGTLVGAFITAKIAASHKMKFAIGVGAFYLLGGIAAASMLGGPVWFIVADLVLAYIPMAYLGGKLAGGERSD